MQMGTEIMRSQSQANNQPFVPKNAFLVAEYGIGELRMEGREGPGLVVAGVDDSDMDGLVGITGPCALS